MFLRDNIIEHLRIMRFVIFVSISKAAIEISFALLFMLWLVENILTHKGSIKSYFPKTTLNLPLAVWAGVCLLSVFHSVDPSFSARKFFSRVVEYTLVFSLQSTLLTLKSGFGKSCYSSWYH